MLKTIAYIDGYNLYYSRLSNGPYKWLDFIVLFENLLREQSPDDELVQIKYFTAPAKASFASHGEASTHAQTQYLRALQSLYPDRLTVIQGFHTLQSTTRPSFVEGQTANKSIRSAIWEVEEKQTDVNLALHIYSDAMHGRCEQMLVCSNDSDLEPALRFVRQDAPNIRLGLILPLTPPSQLPLRGQQRISNKMLLPLAHWVRHHLRDEELAKAQLPTSINTRKKPATKPAHW